jgi:anti-sigma factor RsiW
MIDVYALARAVYVNRSGQTGIAPAKGEHQAFARLRRAGLLVDNGALHPIFVPTSKGFALVKKWAKDVLAHSRF